MKKYLIYSDPHFCQYSSIIRKRGKKYSLRLENLIKSISWAEKEAEKRNCDEVICCGDFFDRSDLNAEEITAFQDIYFSKLPHIIITGNHDSNVASLDYSSVKIFKKNSDVLTKPKLLSINDYVDICFIPYISEKKVFDLEEYFPENYFKDNPDKKKIIITHNDIAGIRYGKYLSEVGFSISDILKSITLFINGHLHNGYMINEKIVLVGNLTGLNFNENSKKYEHYAYQLTIDDNGAIELDPIVNPYAFNFYKLYINNPNDIEYISKLKPNSVLSVICKSDYITQVEKEIKDLKNKVVEYRITASYDYDDCSEDGELNLGVNDHFKQFIEYVQTKIEPSQILIDELALLGE